MPHTWSLWHEEIKLVTLTGKKNSMADQAIGPSRESNTLFLLNGHSNQQPPKIYRLVHPSNLIKDISFCHKWWLIQKSTAGQVQGVRECETLCSEWGSHTHLLAARLRNTMGEVLGELEEPEVEDIFTKWLFPNHDHTMALRISQWSYCRHKTCRESRRWAGLMKSHPPTEELLATDSSWKRKS